MKQLIITCDDAGLSKGINQSIYTLNAEGLATTASVLTNFDYLDHAIQTLSSSQVALGVHLNLTDGFPLDRRKMDDRLLDRKGRFNKSIYELMLLMAWSDSGLRSAVEGELTLQIERLLDFGVHPGHLTSHMHFHVLPALRDIVFRLAGTYHVQWIRTYQLSRTIVPGNVFQDHHLPAVFDAARPAPLDYVIDISWWRPLPPARLVQALLNLRGCVELVVHPSEAADDTYPAYLPNKPLRRYAQVVYLREVMRILGEHDHDFLLHDPSLESSAS